MTTTILSAHGLARLLEEAIVIWEMRTPPLISIMKGWHTVSNESKVFMQGLLQSCNGTVQNETAHAPSGPWLSPSSLRFLGISLSQMYVLRTSVLIEKDTCRCCILEYRFQLPLGQIKALGWRTSCDLFAPHGDKRQFQQLGT
jgi:hypothetical protein